MRPALFVGSSSEGREIAECVQAGLDLTCEVEVWSQGAFGLSGNTLESLVLVLDRFDFAVLVVTADDMVIKRGVARPAPRDNIIFELDLFMGGLGRERTFILYDRMQTLELPSDLAGIAHVTFEPHESGNLEAALGAACTRLRLTMKQLGLRDASRLRRLTEAANTLEAAGADLERLVKLIARSRKVELEIFLEQFGPVIGSDRARSIRKDLEVTKILRQDENVRNSTRWLLATRHPRVCAVSGRVGAMLWALFIRRCGLDLRCCS
jgi:hypothetical protein